MAIDRAALTAYLATEYDTLLAEARIQPTDTADGLASVLDAVQRVVDQHDDLDVAWHRPLGQYFVLQRIAHRLAANMDVSDTEGSYKLSQQFQNAKWLLGQVSPLVSGLVTPASRDDANAVGILSVRSRFLRGGEVSRW